MKSPTAMLDADDQRLCVVRYELLDQLQVAFKAHLSAAIAMTHVAGFGKHAEFRAASDHARLMGQRYKMALSEYRDHIREHGCC